MKQKTLFILLIISFLACKNDKKTIAKYDFWVGSYTKKEAYVAGKGEGIYHLQLDENLNEISRSVITDVVNPSFICLDDEQKRLFCVQETNPDGLVASYDLTQFPPRKLSEHSSKGGAPCYAFYKNGFCFTANYVGGNVAMYRVNNDGTLGAEPSVINFYGKGKTARQEAPHPHAAAVMGNELLVPDLGTDYLNCLKIDFQNGKLLDNQPIKSEKEGAGPRHLVFSEKNIYLANELNSSVTFIDANRKQVQTLSTLSKDSVSNNLVSDIQITHNKQFLYVANRGENNLAAYKILADGTMQHIGNFDCKGLIPRNFNISPDGKYLFCSNQNSDNIAIFVIENDGKLTYKKDLLLKTPTCIVFVGKKI